MDVKAYLDKVAKVVPSNIPEDDGEVYISKFDNSYITRVGMEDDAKFLADLEITDELTNGVGFSPLHNKWFGWSHRACYGFTIGSTCKKGDCHYRPADIEDAADSTLRFWDDAYHEYTAAEVIDANTIEVSWKYNDKVPNESLRGKFCAQTHKFGDFGRGEWVVETMGDAKQMAIDFSRGVS